MAKRTPGKLLVIACGALAKEIMWLRDINHWHSLELVCLDAELHNTPDAIPQRLHDLIAKHHPHYDQIFIGYGDCGTGGHIDKVLAHWNLERLPGAHCYAFYATESVFNNLADTEPGTFYLTDFLARHFDRLVIRGLKLDSHPQLRDTFFGHYTRVLYLAQRDNPALLSAAQRAADFLDLRFDTITTGMGALGTSLEHQVLKLQRRDEASCAAH